MLTSDSEMAFTNITPQTDLEQSLWHIAETSYHKPWLTECI